MAQELPLAACAAGSSASILQRACHAGSLACPPAVASARAGWCVRGWGGGAALLPAFATLGTLLDGSVLQATRGDSPVASPLPLEPVAAVLQLLCAWLPAAIGQGTILLLVESGFLPDVCDTKPGTGAGRIKILSLLSPSCISSLSAPPASVLPSLSSICADLQTFQTHSTPPTPTLDMPGLT